MWRRSLQAAGDWTLSLDPATPLRIRDVLEDLEAHGFAHVFTTPVHIPDGALSPDDLIAQARHTGLLRSVKTASEWEGQPVELSGPSIAALLGDEDGKGDTPATAVTQNKAVWNGASSSWILDHVLNGANGLTAGTIATHTTTYNMTFKAGTTRRQILTAVCRVSGREWRINPDGTLDVDTPANLWREGEVMVGPFTGGRDGTIAGIEGRIEVAPADLDDWSSTVRVNDSGVTNTGVATIGANPYVGFAGSPLVMRRFVDSSQANSATQAGQIAANQLGRFDQVDRLLRISADYYDLAGVIEPGDTFWVADPSQRITDVTNQVQYRGEVHFPLALRLLADTSPFEFGMGAGVRYWDGAAFQTLDITPYVMAEQPGAELEVGALPRPVLTTAVF